MVFSNVERASLTAAHPFGLDSLWSRRDFGSWVPSSTKMLPAVIVSVMAASVHLSRPAIDAHLGAFIREGAAGPAPSGDLPRGCQTPRRQRGLGAKPVDLALMPEHGHQTRRRRRPF